MSKCRVLVVLWATGRCNLKCKYCYASEGKEQFDMDFKIAAKALDYFGNQPMKIQFAGGEPLLNFSLIRNVYEYVKLKGYDATFQMQTNATLIDLDIAREIKKMNISIGVSMDGSPTINEYLRGGTKKTVHGIQCLAKAGVRTNINSVVTDKNVDKLYELVDLAIYLGNINGIGLDLLREVGRAKENKEIIKMPTNEQLESGINALYERSNILYKNTGKKIVIREIEDARKRFQYSLDNKNYCYASCGKSYVVIPNGDIYPCGSLVNNHKYYMGSIINKDIKSILLDKKELSKCRVCEYEALCPGGCPSRLIVNDKSTIGEPLDCTLKKIAFKIASK